MSLIQLVPELSWLSHPTLGLTPPASLHPAVRVLTKAQALVTSWGHSEAIEGPVVKTVEEVHSGFVPCWGSDLGPCPCQANVLTQSHTPSPREEFRSVM